MAWISILDLTGLKFPELASALNANSAGPQAGLLARSRKRLGGGRMPKLTEYAEMAAMEYLLGRGEADLNLESDCLPM